MIPSWHMGKTRFYSYWDLGKIPTSHLFRIGWSWHTTASCLPALPGYIHDATAGYTGRETCTVSRGRSLWLYTNLGERKGQSQISSMSALSLETVIKWMHFLSTENLHGARPSLYHSEPSGPQCLVYGKVQGWVLCSGEMLRDGLFVCLSPCLFTMVHCYSSIHICEWMRRKNLSIYYYYFYLTIVDLQYCVSFRYTASDSFPLLVISRYCV